MKGNKNKLIKDYIFCIIKYLPLLIMPLFTVGYLYFAGMGGFSVEFLATSIYLIICDGIIITSFILEIIYIKKIRLYLLAVIFALLPIGLMITENLYYKQVNGW